MRTITSTVFTLSVFLVFIMGPHHILLAQEKQDSEKPETEMLQEEKSFNTVSKEKETVKKKPLSMALRYNLGVEIELYFNEIGVLYGIQEKYKPEVSLTCAPERSGWSIGARKFLKGPQVDTWFLGVFYENNKYSKTDGCTEVELDDLLQSGSYPMFGYSWVFEGGYNFELGLRPGMLAFGISF